MIGDTLSSYIQIRNNNYFKSDFGDGYSKMNIPYGVEGVTNWKSVISKTLGNNNLKQYNGNDNQMSYDLMVDHAYNYEEQSELGFNFKNIFFKGGIIRTRKEVYPPSQLNRTHEVIDISHQPINCADIMRDLSFDPDENAKPISVNSIFYIYDTVLTETALRPHPSLSIHTSDTDSISIDQLLENTNTLHSYLINSTIQFNLIINWRIYHKLTKIREFNFIP
ncbi:MAG: hypothetical protein IPL55_01540 [Saprospiraceae bacterium]|nr:hypothetical protein [Saprospiraceae bacterium]